VLACIEEFGGERSFSARTGRSTGSIAPTGDVLDACATIICDFSADEQTALFGENADRIFRLAD